MKSLINENPVMTIRKVVCICTASLFAGLMTGVTYAQPAMKSAASAQQALATLNRVVGHTQRLITAKNYARLPHENGEFEEGAEALERAIANESPDFKSKVEPLLTKAQADSQSVADAATAHDDAKLAAAHAAFADSVKAVLAAFPPEAQPLPPSRGN
jgi:hypothetical protein